MTTASSPGPGKAMLLLQLAQRQGCTPTPRPAPLFRRSSRRYLPLGLSLWMCLCWLGLCDSSAETRAEWVVAQIAAKNAGLAKPARDEKYQLMGESQLAFFRATNYLFWSDEGRSPKLSTFGGPRTRTWLQGDAHAENIGALSNSSGTVVYDLDDFDESLIGDYQLDLWRLAVSLVLMTRDREGGSTQDKSEQAAVLDALSLSYVNTLSSYRDNDHELTQVYTANNTPSILSDFLLFTEGKTTHKMMLDKCSTTASGVRMFDFNRPEVLPVPASFVAAVQAAMPGYISSLAGRVRWLTGYFKVKDVAQRVSQGMGSRGIARYNILIEGPTLSQDDDRILDVKAQLTPSGWPYMDPVLRDQLTTLIGGDQALRNVLGNRVLGYRVDDHLGTMTLLDEHFVVRERTPARGAMELAPLLAKGRAVKMAEQWGAVLATAHARADQDSSPLIPYDFEKETLQKIGNQRGAFATMVRQEALRYAAQVESDYRAFVEALVKPQGAPPAPKPTPQTTPATPVTLGS